MKPHIKNFESAIILILIMCCASPINTKAQGIFSIYSSIGFENPANIIDGNVSTYATLSESGYGEIVIQLEESCYLTDLILDIRDSYEGLVQIHTSQDETNFTYVGEVDDDFGIFNIDVDQYVKYVKIMGEINTSNSNSVIEISELEINFETYKISFSYDNNGNRITRERIILSETSAHKNYEQTIVVGDDKVKIYPNPTKGIIRFEWLRAQANEGHDPFKVTVSDLNGKIVLQEVYNNNHFNVDLSKQPKGLYLMIFENDQLRKEVSIIKN